MQQDDALVEVDEMRLGLPGRLRRVWATGGVKGVQKGQFVFQWTYRLLGVHPLTGTRIWDWIDSLKPADLLPARAKGSVAAVLSDSASSHGGKQVGRLPFKRSFQPAYSPELNPVERIFEALRRAVEGVIDATLAAKKPAVAFELHQLAADPQRVQRLTGWDWLWAALDSLPDHV